MRPHRWVLRVVSRLVPRDLREHWLDEWTAEIAYRERQIDTWQPARRAPFDLLRRSTGAFWDAMWLRTSRWYSLRLFGREWRLALTAVLSLATAIAAVVIGLAAYDAFLLAPPGTHDASDLRMIHVSSTNDAHEVVSFPAYREYRAATSAFADIAAFPTSISGNTLKRNAVSFQVWTAEVSDNFFSVLGVRAERGNLVVSGPKPGGLNAGDIVISDALWRRLGAEPGIVGSTLEVNDKTLRINGVAALAFRGMSWGFTPEIWMAFATTQAMNDPGSNRLEQPGNHWLHLIGRVKPGARTNDVMGDAAMLASIVDRAPGAAPIVHRAALSAVSVTPPDDRAWMSTILGALLLIVGLTLVVACANVTNLLLGLAVSRRHEMIVRAALGASPLQLILPLVREGAMLGLVAGIVGSAGAFAALTKLASLRYTFSAFMPEFSLDVRPHLFVWVAALVIACVAGALAAALPAFRSATDAAEGLTQRASTGSRRHARTRRLLVALQMTVCTVVLTALGLAAHSLFNLRHISLGFQARDLVYADIDVARTGFDAKTGPAFYRRVLDWMSAMPGMRSATLASNGPLDGGLNTQNVTRDGSTEKMSTGTTTVDDRYFATIDMPLVGGRAFDSRDRAGSADVGIVNATLAHRLWPGQSPIGQYLRVGEDHRRVEVVGVARDGKYGDIDEEPTSMLYLPLAQHYLPTITVIARTQATPFEVVDRLSTLAPAPVMGGGGAFTLNDLLQLSLAMPRVIVLGAMMLGTVALGLTIFALYSTVFYSISQRRTEIGIRLALGATPAQLFRLVLGESARMSAIGAAIGLLAAALLTPIAGSLFVGIGATDPTVLAGVTLVCALTTVAISIVVVRPWTRVPATMLLR